MTTQTTYTFGNLQITQTIMESKTEIVKVNEVSRFDGECFELLSEMDADFTKAMILMHNEKNS